MEEKSDPISTHNVGVAIPANTKYISRNPISRYLIRQFMRAMIELADQIDPSVVLDIGCGEGLIIRQQRVLWDDVEFHGVDIDLGLLRVAQQVEPRASYIAGSIYQMPFPTDAYDTVICTEVLEHLGRPGAALAECARVGREHCLLSVPNEPWWRIANMIRGSYLGDWGNTPGHINHWSESEFMQFASDCLDIVDIRRPFPWTVILGKIRH